MLIEFLFSSDISLSSFEFDSKKIEFNKERERVTFKFNLINIQGKNLVKVGEFKVRKIF